MYSLIALYVARWLKHRRDVALLHRLLHKDDSVLEDIGLRRADIQQALRLAPTGFAREEAGRLSRCSLRLDCRI